MIGRLHVNSRGVFVTNRLSMNARKMFEVSRVHPICRRMTKKGEMDPLLNNHDYTSRHVSIFSPFVLYFYTCILKLSYPKFFVIASRSAQ